MNKEVIELKQKRAEAIESMNTIVELCKTEKRVKSEDEQKAFDKADKAIAKLDAQIVEEERMEALNKTIKPKNVVTPEEKAARRYDGAKAMEHLRAHKEQTGLEAELHQEGRAQFGRAMATDPNAMYIPDFMYDKEARADFAYASATNDYDTDNLGLDIIVSPSLYSQLGSTVYRGLTAKTILNFEDGNSASFPGEGTTVVESTPTRTTDGLDPRRVGGKKGFSNELLSVSNFFPQQLADMVASIDRAISADVISKANLANINAAREAADVAAAIDWGDVTALGQDLENDNFLREAYVMSKQVYSNNLSIVKDSGSGQFLIDGQGILGIPAYGTTQLPIHDTNKYDMIYGDWSRSFVGFFGNAMEVLMDPYTDGATGVTNVIFNRIADTAVNPAAFESYRNILLT